ncbi:hypothetical protein SPBR_07325 [Sporothrix brasiliensis 5110]|uniref:Mitochondrial export translocase n=1 Tax=Sporothrix brasiliensis 5110 TaxID=1398154 RepID=A0A0C2IW70_9PEZI|nr:uncharacterized protein SPBR_07325 [Sporothrix brasiliensis 5110]KIH89222.1 hypothetical protein SPBR_07325 [Sporothrix brasiliensis 5110]
MAQPSARGLRALRAAAATLPPSAPVSGQQLSQTQHRSFSSRPLPPTPAPRSLSGQRTRPRQSLVSGEPLCRHRQLQLQTASARRSFHFASIANATVDAAEAAIAQLHAVSHTPWYVTIPLVALGVNLVFRLPFTLHARNLVIRRERLAPLLQAWTTLHGKEIINEQKLRSRQGLPMPKTHVEVMKRYRKTANRVFGAFGLQQWKLYSNILSLPPWLVVIEAIRRMCGAPTGLLGLLFRSGGAGAAGAAETSASATAAAAASASAEYVDVASIASAAPPSSTATDSVSSLVDPTFATGGCLWFPDLTVADPCYVLPFALSAALVVNILPKTDAARRALFGLKPAASSSGAVAIESKGAQTILRALLLLSLSVGPLTLHFPAAIHLYWLSSAVATHIITRCIRLLRPLRSSTSKPALSQDMPWIRPRAPGGRPSEKH